MKNLQHTRKRREMVAEFFKVSEVAYAYKVIPLTFRRCVKPGGLKTLKTGGPILMGLEDICEFIERTQNAVPNEPKVERKQ